MFPLKNLACKELINIASGIGFFPDGTRIIPEPMHAYYLLEL